MDDKLNVKDEVEESRELTYIPVSKVARATKFAKTGVRVGGNFVKHYTRKLFSNEDNSTLKAMLHSDNASDIYDGLSELKGSALKILQMMSVDQNLLPTPYSEKFSLSQYSTPPLSFPLVEQTFRKAFNKTPSELFTSFERKAAFAASIGQVHRAQQTISGVDYQLAVKIQYPGVADSIDADLRIVKPFAVRLFNLNPRDVDYFTEEVRSKLIDETNYRLELKNGEEIGEQCKSIGNLIFPKYFKELSSDKILTMEWLDGAHLDDFLNKFSPTQDLRNSIGQTLWEFYHFQFHVLKKTHADPHPGNFLFLDDGRVAVLDFGCVKELDEQFYKLYFSMLSPQLVKDEERLDKVLESLRFLHDFDSAEERRTFRSLFGESIALLAEPFEHEYFDFGDKNYFKSLYEFGEKMSRNPVLRASRVARGPREGLYVNRTYFGLYNMLHRLEAKIKVLRPDWLLKVG
jgi:predicted unusual protein kinase regulating ubiquinone biosynthesis (AarF/ABC1/UbiB family)